MLKIFLLVNNLTIKENTNIYILAFFIVYPSNEVGIPLRGGNVYRIAWPTKPILMYLYNMH